MSVDNYIPRMVWTDLFYKAQVFLPYSTLLHKDNISSIWVEVNDKTLSGKSTIHPNIICIIKCQVYQGWVKIEFFHMEDMVQDHYYKSLQGIKFRCLCELVINFPMEFP